MSNTQGNGDGGSAVPVDVETVADTTVPLSEDTTWEALSDAAETLTEAGQEREDDDETWARDARAALAGGDRSRADALECARAFRFERRGRGDEALVCWRAAFESDPRLQVAFWGLRRALETRGAWDELPVLLERRIAALASLESGARSGESPEAALTPEEARAELWLSRGRVLEDRLGRDDEAARSYRTGLIEAPGHPGLLFSLALLGWRRSDSAMAAEALTGFLRLGLPPAARAAMTAAVARIERSTGRAAGAPGTAGVDAISALRALETLRGALGAVGPRDAGPLLAELWVLARGVADPLARVEILQELVKHLPPQPADVVVGVLRERSRLQHAQLGDKRAAMETLRQALKVQPGHPLVVAELADLIEEAGAEGTTDGTSEGASRVADELADLLAEVAPSERPLAPGVEQELALRLLVTLVREGRAGEGLTFVGRHPELRGVDAEILQVALRALTGDLAGLISDFDGAAGRHEGSVAAGNEGGRRDAAQAHVIAGTLRAWEGASEPAAASYRSAVAVAPGFDVAVEALERHLLATGDGRALSDQWRARLAHAGSLAVDATTRRRLLEELVALHRDDLDDLDGARRFQDELGASSDDPRSHLRRLALEHASGAGLATPPTPVIGASLRSLGDHAGAADVQTALHVEAGLALAAPGATPEVEELLRATLATDPTGRAASGLERLLAADPGARADVVRLELGRVEAEAPGSARGRALRFRVAHHLAAAGRPGEAIEILEPLRSAGDDLAAAFAWEIARRSRDPELASAVLEATTDATGEDLQVASDLGEALEASGDLTGAAEAYRAVLSKEPSADAALGLFRSGALTGEPALVIEASGALGPFADDETRLQLGRDATLLSLLARGQGAGTGATESPSGVTQAEDEATAMLSWATAMESRDVVSTSAGLLALARVTSDAEAVKDRNGLLARAAARSRLGGVGLAAAVHDQAQALSDGAAAIEIGLSDLPVGGRPERAAARANRAARSGGRLGYALDIERAVDAEARGDAAPAMEAYSRAARRDPSGIEALDGIRRVAQATGNRLGAARAGMRLGAVLKTAHRAAVEFRRAAAIWQEEGKHAEAKVAAWQALAREPASEAVFEFLRGVLIEDGDHAGLDRLLGLRLAVVTDPRARVPLWLDRATNRLDRLEQSDGAIQDFKRILRVVSNHRAALRALATLAVKAKQLGAAIDFLKRLLVVESDGVGRRDLMLELSRAHEAARERARALALVKEAIAGRPDDEVPRQALVDLLLRSRNWGGARDALETWQETVAAPEKKAALWIRIGELWRDEDRDRSSAAAAFTRAATLDPLGAGLFRLAELQARFGDVPAQRAVLDAAITAFRSDLARDPLDAARLRRLGELYAARVTGSDADELSALGIAVVGQALALLGVAEKPLDGRLAALGGAAQRDIAPRGGFGAAFLTHLRAPGASGFAAEIWAKVARTATEMFEAAHVKPPARERVATGSEPRLAWIEVAAAAVGLPTLELMLSKRQGPSDESVVAIDVGEPALVVGRAAFSASAAVRFAVGRALSLLRDRAVMFDSRTPVEIATLFGAAARAAGVAAPAEEQAQSEVAGYAKNMLRLMSRKDRKALELEASRFGFETIDGPAFQSGVLATADRLGLVLAGDVEVAIRVVCGGAPTPDDIAVNPRALELLRFALGADYLVLKRDADGGGG